MEGSSARNGSGGSSASNGSEGSSTRELTLVYTAAKGQGERRGGGEKIHNLNIT